MSKDTQVKQVLQRIRECGSITSMEAFTEFGITRLAAVIYVIRHDFGIDIKSDTVTGKNRFGNPVNYARYSLAA